MSDRWYVVRVKRAWVPFWLWCFAAWADSRGQWIARWLTRERTRQEMIDE